YQGKHTKKLAEAEELRASENPQDVERAIKALGAIVKACAEEAAASEKARNDETLSPLVKEENDRLAEERDLKIAKDNWETEYENFKSGPLKRVAAAVNGAKKRGDEKQLQFIKDLAENAHKLGKEAKDIPTIERAH